MAAAAIPSASRVRNGMTSGAGAYSATMPATSGPSPSPARVAPALKLAALQRPSQSSASQAVPALAASGMPSPLKRRPRNSIGIESAKRKTKVATMLMATAARIATRRPVSSDSRPKKKAVVIAPPK